MTANTVGLSDLATSRDFNALIAAWEADRRCPIGLADFLFEHGLEQEAKAAEWAASGEDRRDNRGGSCGVFPWDGGTGNWWWSRWGVRDCNRLPMWWWSNDMVYPLRPLRAALIDFLANFIAPTESRD